MDFLPAGWLVKIDDLRASMQMGQPFPGVWLPRNLRFTRAYLIALGPMELLQARVLQLSQGRRDVEVTVPK